MRDRFFGSSLTVSANQGVERNLISAYRLTYDCAASRLHDPLEKNDVIETGFSYDQIEVLPGQLRKIRSYFIHEW